MMTFNLINLEQSTTLHVRVRIGSVNNFSVSSVGTSVFCYVKISWSEREIVRDQARRSLPLTAGMWWWCHERKYIILPFFSTPKTWTLFNDSTWNMQEFYKIFLLLLIWYLFFNKIIALEDIRYFFYKVAEISSSSNGFYSYLPYCVQP